MSAADPRVDEERRRRVAATRRPRVAVERARIPDDRADVDTSRDAPDVIERPMRSQGFTAAYRSPTVEASVLTQHTSGEPSRDHVDVSPRRYVDATRLGRRDPLRWTRGRPPQLALHAQPPAPHLARTRERARVRDAGREAQNMVGERNQAHCLERFAMAEMHGAAPAVDRSSRGDSTEPIQNTIDELGERLTDVHSHPRRWGGAMITALDFTPVADAVDAHAGRDLELIPRSIDTRGAGRREERDEQRSRQMVQRLLPLLSASERDDPRGSSARPSGGIDPVPPFGSHSDAKVYSTPLRLKLEAFSRRVDRA